MLVRCAFWSGVLLIGVAVAAVPSVAIVESYVGGSAVHGHVEDGRYFVNPGHGQPIAEVSESTWRRVYWVERLWPFSALIPCWLGMALLAYGMGPDWKPAPVPPGDPPVWVLRACGVAALITVGGAAQFWMIVRVPWATQLVGWILFCVSVGSIVWLYTRWLRQQQTAESGSEPEPAGDAPSAAPDRGGK
jgi:hypothetical protein